MISMSKFAISSLLILYCASSIGAPVTVEYTKISFSDNEHRHRHLAPIKPCAIKELSCKNKREKLKGSIVTYQSNSYFSIFVIQNNQFYRELFDITKHSTNKFKHATPVEVVAEYERVNSSQPGNFRIKKLHSIVKLVRERPRSTLGKLAITICRSNKNLIEKTAKHDIFSVDARVLKPRPKTYIREGTFIKTQGKLALMSKVHGVDFQREISIFLCGKKYQHTGPTTEKTYSYYIVYSNRQQKVVKLLVKQYVHILLIF